MLKRYSWPLLLAVIINALVIYGLIHLFHSPVAHKKPAYVKVNLQQLVQHMNQHSAKQPGSETAWLQKHYGKAVTIKKKFSAGNNLTGYLVSLKSDPASKSVIYSVNQGEYYFIGTVLDRAGHNISQHDAHKYISSPRNKAIYLAAQKLPGIVQGKASAPQATIIIDPNSNLFPEQWNDLHYDIGQGVFRIKWVLVNYLKPMGPNVANAILQAKHPADALKINAEQYQVKTQTGGYAKDLPLTTQNKNLLRNNWSFIQKYNLYQLPVTILKVNQHYYVLQGAVMDEMLETLFADAK